MDAAWRAVETRIAKPLGVSVEQAADAVRSVANGLMAQAIRLVTVERGHDPREFAFVPFGGAGPVHAVDLARQLEIPTILVHPLPGMFSAFGMLVADLVHDLQAAVVRNIDALEPGRLEASYRELEQQAHTAMLAAGLAKDQFELRRRADCSYLSQAETLQIEVPSDPVNVASLARIAADFTAEHQRHWNFTQPERPVSLVNIRVRAFGHIGTRLRNVDAAVNDGAPQPRGEANVLLRGARRAIPRYARADLLPGQSIAGPAVIDELSSSIVIGGADRARLGTDSVLIVDVGRQN